MSSLVRRAGLFDATTLVVGSMIGSGIFLVSAQSARTAGSPGALLAVWVLAGILTLMAALCCAELAAMLPKAGGQYVFLKKAFGAPLGFLFGWTLFWVIQSGTIAAVAVAFAKFLGVLWPAASTERGTQLVALSVIGFLTAANGTGLKTGTLMQNVFTCAKLAALLGLTVLGLTLGGGSGVALHSPAFWAVPDGGALALIAGLGVAMVGPMFSQSAWTNVTFAGEEIREPGQVLPRSLLIGCVTVVTVYVLANVAYLNVLPFAAVQRPPGDRLATAVATSLLGEWGARLCAAAIMASTFGCLNGLILSGARVYFAMARDGLFFRRLQTLNAAQVPAHALWAQGLWAGALAISGTYSQLLEYVISVDLVFYVLLVSAVMVLRKKSPGAERPFRVPGYPFVPLAYIAFALSLMVILLIRSPTTTWPGYALVLTGVPAYLFWKRSPKATTTSGV